MRADMGGTQEGTAAPGGAGAAASGVGRARASTLPQRLQQGWRQCWQGEGVAGEGVKSRWHGALGARRPDLVGALLRPAQSRRAAARAPHLWRVPAITLPGTNPHRRPHPQPHDAGIGPTNQPMSIVYSLRRGAAPPCLTLPCHAPPLPVPAFSPLQDKINAFWEITKKELDDRKAELRNKDREMEEMEERHQVEIKVGGGRALSSKAGDGRGRRRRGACFLERGKGEGGPEGRRADVRC